nr:exopolygalacturonase [Quercus suber]
MAIEGAMALTKPRHWLLRVKWKDIAGNSNEEFGGYIGNRYNRIALTIGYIPGLKVDAISLRQSESLQVVLDKFVKHIRDYTATVLASSEPAGIIMFGALTKAWKAACAAAGSKVVISKGVYKLGLVTLLGPCKGAIEFNLQGTLQAPSNVASFNGKDGWVVFERIDGLTVSGGGVFDGQGKQAWQKNECNTDKNCNILPINIRFNYVTNSKVQDITSKDNKFFHINLLGCKKLQFQHVTITAPVNSPNTDGIHVGRSSQITITNANIGTGDDCISVGDGAQDIIVNQVTCGPGHGISIGSLGRYQNEEPVSGITVTGATRSNTNNGVRIKTWPASTSGVASDIHFEDVVMNNVANPIIIDQKYCPNSQYSNESPSKVKISNVSFKKIRGTSSTKEAMNLICSRVYHANK